MALTLVIMAAGMGSRYGGLKQIDPVGPNGEIIMDYSVYDAKIAGFEKVVFVIKEENYELFRQAIGKRIEDQIKVEYVFQKIDALPEEFSVPDGRVKPWGTGHAILCCKDVIDDNFAVINADDFYGRDSFKLIAEFLKSSAKDSVPYKFCMAGYMLGNTLTENGYVSRGVCRIDSENMLDTVVERTQIQRINGSVCYNEDGEYIPLDENSTVSMNCWGFTPSFFKELEKKFEYFLKSLNENEQKAEFYLPFAVKELIDEKKCTVKVLKTEEKWFGVTYKEDRNFVVSSILKKIEDKEYPNLLWN